MEAIAVFTVWAGKPGGSYTHSVIYDKWDECVRDVEAAVAKGRQILIEPETMSREEYESSGDGPIPAGANGLLDDCGKLSD